MKHTRNTCALAAFALTALTMGAARADVGVLPDTPAVSSQHTQPPAKQQFVPAVTAFPSLHTGEKSDVVTDLGTTVYRPLTLKPAGHASVIAPKTFKIITMDQAYRLAADYPQSSSYSATISLRAGESAVYDFAGITTTAVGDPTIADIVPLTKNQLLINAKAPGSTTIIVFDLRGKTLLHITVTPQLDPDEIAEKIEGAIGNPAVTATAVNNTILLEGTVSSLEDQQRADTIAGAFTTSFKDLIEVTPAPGAPSEAEKYATLLTQNLSQSGITVQVLDEHTIILTGKYASPIAPPPPNAYGNGGGMLVNDPDAPNPSDQKQVDPLDRLLASLPSDLHVINLINFETQSPKQILVRCKVIEINRSDERQFGVDWGTANVTEATQTITNSNGTTTTSPELTANFLAQPILFTQSPATDLANGLLGGGPLHRFQPFAFELQALIQENKARVLSEPSLLVLDGNQGSILVGGQIPIPTPQAQSNTIAITYEPFGIRLNVQPVVVGDNTVQLTVTPEVSALDFGNAITVEGTTVPALTIRRVTTTLQMQSGQTLVIGGLYDSNYSKVVQRIPVLSQIPILGEFFKDTTNNKTETELLVLIETEIVTDTTAGIQPPAPGTNQNPGIVRPFVGNHEFQKDMPDIDKFVTPDNDNADVPKQSIDLPAAPGQEIGK